MLSFRKKIFLIDLVVLIVFISILFPLVGLTVNHIMRKSLTNRGKVLIAELKRAPNTEAMIEMMKTHNEFIFQPVSLLDGEGTVISHSYLSEPSQPIQGPEIRQAIKSGRGFSEHLSSFFQQNMYYVALAFTAHGERFILHVNFRASEVDQLKHSFEVGIFIVCILLLVVTSIVDSIVATYLMRPVEKIIQTIRTYKEGKDEFPPRIVLDEAMQGGEFSKLAFTLNSLTDRIQRQIENLTRQREETEEILESLGEGIIAVDTSAKVTFANRTAHRMLGVSRDQILKQTLNSIKAESMELAQKCHEVLVHALQTSEPMIHTWSQREKGPFHLELIAAPLAHQSGALLVLQDKTSDYRILELGKDFIANASHELRTPITIIRGYAETLQDLPELSQEMLQGITEKIVRTCGRLDKLVRSLLTLSDIENLSQDRFKTADLVLIAENCKHHLLAANPHIKMATHIELESAPIIADADLLELAILNILENAVKYSPTPAEIEMGIKKMGETIHLSIKDKGIGISEADLPHIFDRFYTVDKARSRKSGGAGLGLSIVKTILEKHKGSVIVKSELGKGSVFTLVLPFQVKVFPQ